MLAQKSSACVSSTVVTDPVLSSSWHLPLSNLFVWSILYCPTPAPSLEHRAWVAHCSQSPHPPTHPPPHLEGPDRRSSINIYWLTDSWVFLIPSSPLTPNQCSSFIYPLSYSRSLGICQSFHKSCPCTLLCVLDSVPTNFLGDSRVQR